MKNEEIFFAAVEKGIEQNGVFFEFEDPGFSIAEMHDICLQRRRNVSYEDRDLFYSFFVAPKANYPWLHTKDEPKRVCLRFPKKAIGMSLENQRGCLAPSEHVASARRIVTFLLLRLLAEKPQLGECSCVRCAECAESYEEGKDHPNYVGMFLGKVSICCGFHIGEIARVGIAAEAN